MKLCITELSEHLTKLSKALFIHAVDICFDAVLKFKHSLDFDLNDENKLNIEVIF